jgi:hypothetical protein
VAQSILEDLPEQTFTEDTIKRMYGLVDRAKTDPEFQKFVYGLVNGSMHGQWKNYKGEITTVFNWLKSHIDYRRDPFGVELLQDVWATMDNGRGDCDDFTIFLAAASEVLGAPSRIVTVSTRQDKEPSHVYAEANIGGKWQGLDATVQQSFVGWVPPQVTDRKIWTRKDLGLPGGADDMEGFEGLGSYFRTTNGGRMRGLGHLGDAAAAAVAATVTSAVKSGAVPNTPAAIQQAVSSAVDALPAAAVAAPAPAPTQPPPGASYEPSGGPDDFGTMTPVSDKLAPGVADDISKTFASGMPGVTDTTGRRIWRAPVADSSEWTSNPRPGGGVYGPALPVGKRPTPKDLWYLVDRQYVPKVLDPDSAWWGKVPTSKEDLNRMFPGSNGVPDQYLRDIASVPASAIAKVTADVKKQIAAAQVAPADVPAVIDHALQGYALGDTSWAQKLKARLGPSPLVRKPAQVVPARRFMVPAPRPRVAPDLIVRTTSGGRMKGLGSLGDDTAAISAGITGAVQTGAIPNNPVSIGNAISAAVNALTGPATPAPASSMTSWLTALPLGMLALLGGAAYLMMGSDKKSAVRRNPSRRRSSGGRRGGRRGGSIDTKTMIMLGGGGLAAYFLFLKPGAPLAPKPGISIPGLTAQQSAAVSAGVTAAASGISSLLSSKPAAAAPGAAPAPSSATTSNGSTSGMITSYDQINPPAPSPDNSMSMVTSLDS